MRALAICAITLIATIMVVGVMAPALADKASAPGQNKVTICHVDEEGEVSKTITIGAKAAAKHLENHPNDTAGPCAE